MNSSTHNRTRTHPQRTVRRAFTLLEIIVVVTIIALLATIVAPKLLGNIDKAKVSTAKSEIASIRQQVQLYMADQSITLLPDDFDLAILTEGDDATLKPNDLIDPWGHPYQLEIPGKVNRDFDVLSFGRDKQPGGEKHDTDIYNE